ncbi:MAG: hypothetical protein G01um101466_216 [Parcubacteria group bacterium Gr01-1014_66]|nr:MAG: hypothetical protein G01um101466_216 [Parcubacteria group bacterium Gr01-1014_66]
MKRIGVMTRAAIDWLEEPDTSLPGKFSIKTIIIELMSGWLVLAAAGTCAITLLAIIIFIRR